MMPLASRLLGRRPLRNSKIFSPQRGQRVRPHLDRVDAAGDALGFTSREAARPTLLRRRREIGPTVAINTRAPERVAGPFIQFCEENRYSYWEGIEELMRSGQGLAKPPQPRSATASNALWSLVPSNLLTTPPSIHWSLVPGPVWESGAAYGVIHWSLVPQANSRI